MVDTVKSVGDELRFGHDKELVVNGVRISNQCVDATITVGAEADNVRAITIQLKKADGSDVDEVTKVDAYVMANSACTAFAGTGGSTGIAIGTDGALLALVAKKAFVLTSEADGDIDLTYTDTGRESCYLMLVLPNGNKIVSDALANT